MSKGLMSLLGKGVDPPKEDDDEPGAAMGGDESDEDYSEGVADALTEVLGADGDSKKDAFIRAVKLAMKC